MLSIIYLISLMKDETLTNKNNDLSKLKIFSLLICFAISLKPYYLIYLPIFSILLFYQNTRKNFLKLWLSPVFFYCLLFLIFTTFYTFINSSCFIFPLTFTCIENLSWSIDKKYIYETKIWFELWSKGGANPNYVVENRIDYIQGLNWLSNWLNIYFFNKVTDFLLSLAFLSLIFYVVFRTKLTSTNYKKNELILIYFFLIIIFVEWLLKHPTLRYGGYHVIALLFFIPMSFFLSKFIIEFKSFQNKAIILILVTLLLFIIRNINRLHNEYEQYQYNVFMNPKYKFIGADKESYFRYNTQIRDNIENYNTINILGKNFLIATLKKK